MLDKPLVSDGAPGLGARAVMRPVLASCFPAPGAAARLADGAPLGFRGFYDDDRAS
jgi:hypothetical protein